MDITVGNINLINGCLLWSAFVMYLGRRYGLFALLIFLSALCKNVEILFLGLLLFERDTKAYRWFAAGLLSFIALHVAGYLSYPAFYKEWLHNVNTIPEWGALNPASLPAIEGAVFGLCHLLGLYDVWGRMGQMVYLVYVPALLIGSWFALRRVDFSRDRIALLMLAIFAYALILPRFKDYSYVLLIAPAAWVIVCRMGNRYLQVIAVLLVIMPVYKYQPLAVAGLFYAYLLRDLRNKQLSAFEIV